MDIPGPLQQQPPQQTQPNENKSDKPLSFMDKICDKPSLQQLSINPVPSHGQPVSSASALLNTSRALPLTRDFYYSEMIQNYL